MPGSLATAPWITILDNNGHPVSGARIYVYISGTSTPLTVYQDSLLMVPHPQPVVTDSAGRVVIYFAPASMAKFIVKTAADVLIRETDPVASVDLSVGGGYTQTQVNTYAEGTQHNFDPGLDGNTVIECRNENPLTITGFPHSFNGQQITVLANGIGPVAFTSLGASVLGNQLLTFIRNGPTTLAPVDAAARGGTAVFVYHASLTCWRLLSHEQGSWIPFTPTWTAASVNPAIGSGSGILQGRYVLMGRTVSFEIFLGIGGSTTMGTGDWSFALPMLALDTLGASFHVLAQDEIVTRDVHAAVINDDKTTLSVMKIGGTDLFGSLVPHTWGSGDLLRIGGTYRVD